MNIIWTAAGEYGFEPAFMAFARDGMPDLYMNSVIGYVRKWYDGAVMQELFDAAASSVMRETLDGVLWIGLENCAFEREVRERPVLSELRRSCARTFFEQQYDTSRQQWMAQNSLVYSLQSARWNTVLGKAPGLISPWEKKLFHKLEYSGDWDASEIVQHTLEIFTEFFHFNRGRHVLSLLRRLRERLSPLSSRLLPSRVTRAQELNFSQGNGGNGSIIAGKAANRLPLSAAEEENDRLYIENCFGRPLYDREESSRIEQLLCTGSHALCHLYFTKGERTVSEIDDSLTRRAVQGAQMQAEKNRRYYQEKRHFFQNSISRLSQQILNALLVYPQPAGVAGRTGRIAPERVWRAVCLHDDRIFTDRFEEQRPDFSVDLMLDASASRLKSQETIAAQAYVIARSLHICHIPVQVYSFLSLRGYTVLRLFCGYEDTDRDENIFEYFAAGWNRDGLALRGSGLLMHRSPARNRLLILLTDASPNDDRRLPPDRKNGHPLSRDYSGPAGTEDAAAEVRALKKDKVQVMAVLNGEDGNAGAARMIYGDDVARIKDLHHFSDAAGALLQKKIEKFF